MHGSVRHYLCNVFSLPSWLRQCLSLRSSGYDEIEKLAEYRGMTVLSVKAPQGSTLEVPNPSEDMDTGLSRYQIHGESATRSHAHTLVGACCCCSLFGGIAPRAWFHHCRWFFNRAMRLRCPQSDRQAGRWSAW